MRETVILYYLLFDNSLQINQRARERERKTEIQTDSSPNFFGCWREGVSVGMVTRLFIFLFHDLPHVLIPPNHSGLVQQLCKMNINVFSSPSPFFLAVGYVSGFQIWSLSWHATSHFVVILAVCFVIRLLPNISITVVFCCCCCSIRTTRKPFGLLKFSSCLVFLFISLRLFLSKNIKLRGKTLLIVIAMLFIDVDGH